MPKINIVCPSCRRRYSVELSDDPRTHHVNCPFCAAPYSVIVNQSVPQKKMQKSSSEVIAVKVKRYEILSNVIWLVIGIIQIALLYTAAAGVWNVINAIVGLRNCKNITAGNPHVVPYFEGRKPWIIVMAIVNLVLGGVVGVLLVIFDWLMRDYVLRNRSAFEG